MLTAGNDTVWNIAGIEWNSVTNSYDTLDTPDKATLLGGSGDDYIYNQEDANVLIKGGASNDTLTGGGSVSSKFYGGEGVDTFIYRPGGGTDTICDYESGELLQILDAGFSDSSFKNSKLTLTLDAVASSNKEQVY